MATESGDRIRQYEAHLSGEPIEARNVMEALFEAPLTFVPEQTGHGRRYRVQGSVSTAGLLDAARAVTDGPNGPGQNVDALRKGIGTSPRGT